MKIRLQLFAWFLMLAMIALVAPKYPAKVCKSYQKSIGGG